MSENLALNLTRSADQQGARPAIQLDESALSYAALAEQSARMAGLLSQRGIHAGDRVGIMLPNVPQFAAVYYGILWAGAAVVPPVRYAHQ